MSRKELGEMLLEADLISRSQLGDALGVQKTNGERLASVLVRKGILTEKFAVTYLGRQVGFPGIDLSQADIELSLLEIVPLAICEKHRVFPVRLDEGCLQLAMADPTDHDIIEKIESRKSVQVAPLVALESSIKQTVREAGRAQRDGRTRITPDVLKAPGRGRAAEGASPAGPAPERDSASAPTAGAAGAAEDAQSTTPADKPGAQTPATRKQPEAKTDVPAQVKGLTVLIGDANVPERESLEGVLGERKHRVLSAASGKDVLALAREQNPDLLILDANLPGMDGFEVCRQLKQSARLRHVPVVLAVGLGLGWRFAADAKERYGVDDVIERPFDKADLLRRVDLLTDRAQPGLPAEAEAAVRQQLKEGVVALKQERHTDAVAALRRGLDVDPFNDLLHYYLGMAHEKIGQFLAAVEHYERAIQVNPDFYDAIISLANLYQRQHFRRKALEMWELALQATRDEAVRTRLKEHIVGLL